MIFIKKLPKIYQNTIDKPIHNNKKVCYVRNNSLKEEIEPLQKDRMSQKEIDSIIDGIFNEVGYPFNISVMIKTDTKTYDTSLIARTHGYLLTLDHDKIKLEDVIFIKRKNPK